MKYLKAVTLPDFVEVDFVELAILGARQKTAHNGYGGITMGAAFIQVASIDEHE